METLTIGPQMYLYNMFQLKVNLMSTINSDDSSKAKY